MKKIILIALVMAFCSIAIAQTTKVVYTCPMHPEVQQAKPGNCPKCGMNLEKKTIKVAAPKTTPKKSAPKPATSKQTGNIKKPTTTSNANSSNNDVREMKDMMQELKTDVAEIKEIVTELKGTGMVTAENATDEHNHEMHMPAQTAGINVTDAKQGAQVTYTCPMHPEVQSNKPGNCPKCGMKLVVDKTKSSATQPAATTYTCPMHPEVQSNKPGNCPKCGMKLVVDKTKSSTTQPTATTYTCPMHPEVQSNKPGNCPKCGMKLVKEKSPANDGGSSEEENTTMENIRIAKKKPGSNKNNHKPVAAPDSCISSVHKRHYGNLW